MSLCATEFENLPGLDRAKSVVRRALSSGSGIHAILLYGPQGAGKARLARHLASSWMCTTPVDGQACGECSVCKSFASGRAVDFQLVAPWGPANQIKLSSMHYVKDYEKDKERPPIEFVLTFFRTRPLMARNKVVMFDQAHRMNHEAANAFLKTLEEPGPQAKVVMVTDEFSRVLPTIRSRCMCVACELPEPGGVSETELVFGSSPGRLAAVREDSDLFEQLGDLLARTQAAHYGEALKMAEELKTIADRFADRLDLNARAAHAYVLENAGSWLAKMAPHRPDALRAVAKAHRRILGNVNALPVFEDLFLGLLYHG